MSPDSVPHNNRWSARNFGSRRGMIITIWHQFLYLLGRYHRYKTIDWTKVDRLVFVCKGNICRSAYAEIIARNLDIETISFGLDTVDNAPANKNAILTANRLGVNLAQHKTNTLASVNIKQTDLLLAMEPWQLLSLKNTFDDRYQCSLLGLWSKPPIPHIQDPYGMSPAYFEKCFLTIHDAVQHLADKTAR